MIVLKRWVDIRHTIAIMYLIIMNFQYLVKCRITDETHL